MSDMPDFDATAFGTRLHAALQDRGWDVKKLQETVRGRYGRLPGSSYGNVWSYVNGKAPIEPRRELVDAMADLLGVFPEYLLFGGPRTDIEAAATEAALSGSPATQGPDATDIYGRLCELRPQLRELEMSVGIVLMMHMQRWGQARLRLTGTRPSLEEAIEYGAETWDYIMEPLVAFATDADRKSLRLDVTSCGDYVVAMIHALNLSFQAPSWGTSDGGQTEEED